MADIDGDDGDNNITGTDDDDTIDGKGGNDRIRGGDGDDTLIGGTGSDRLIGGDGDDVIYTGDRIPLNSDGDQNEDADFVNGGEGDDTIFGGGDNDQLRGGDDADTFIIDNLGNGSSTNVTVRGGNGGDDADTLDLSLLTAAGFTEVQTFTANPESNGEPGFSGQITVRNPATGQTVNVNYNDIESVVFDPICFTPGTRIATRQGERAVEAIRPGDQIITRDNGIREVAWTGMRRLGIAELALRPNLRPVLIRAGALGAGLPERDMTVSPNHRMLLTGAEVQLAMGESEALAAAKHLVGRPGIERVLPASGATYLHIMFERHEIVLSDGAWSESFQPGDHSMGALGEDQRGEILAIFPELGGAGALAGYRSARASLLRREVVALA